MLRVGYYQEFGIGNVGRKFRLYFLLSPPKQDDTLKVASTNRDGLMNIKEYIYIDREGIDSLLAQLSDEITVSRTVGKTKERAGKASTNLGLSGFIKSFISADIDVEGKTGRLYSDVRMVETAYEQKIEAVLKKLIKSNLLTNSLEEAINSSDTRRSCFLSGDFLFFNKTSIRYIRGFKKSV